MKVVITGPTGAIGMALIQKCIEREIPVLAICHKGSKRISRLPAHRLVTVVRMDMSEYGACAEKLIQMCDPDNGDEQIQTQSEQNVCYGDAIGKNELLPCLQTFRNISVRAGTGINEARVAADEAAVAAADGTDADAVFIHLAWNGTTGAARNDTALQLQNIEHTLDAVRLAKALSCDTFIGAGSQAEYGRAGGKLCAQTPAFPENGYGMAKLCAGQMSRLLCSQLGMRHIWTRILSVYGPYDGQQAMIPTLIRKLAAGEAMQLTKGEQIWDYLYSGDAAEAILALAENGQDGKVYCLGSGQEKTLREYIEECAKAIWEHRRKQGQSIYPACDFVQYLQQHLLFGEIPYQPQQVMYLCADLSELTNDTGFAVQTSFEVGIRETVDSYLNQDRYL